METEKNTTVTLTIELDAWELAYLIEEGHGFFAEWHIDKQYDLVNAVLTAVNNASAEDKAKIVAAIQEGLYTDNSLGQWRVKDGKLIECEELEYQG